MIASDRPHVPSGPEERAGGGGRRIGLVLGGGGAAGLAFHAGVLLALHHDLGWDPRAAEIVVGTSAGSIVGALIRSDVPAEDLAAWASNVRPTAGGDAFRLAMEEAEVVVTERQFPRLALPGWSALAALTSPSQMRAAIMTMLPHGLYDHTPRLAPLDRLVTDWPDRDLWVSAVRVGDGGLAWFGRDRRLTDDVAPADAVRASCAIPVLARPVRIGRHGYLDGGIRSATHADVLADLGLDHVVVLSPMGELEPGRNLFRAAANRRVRQEVAAIERSGTPVTLISPDRQTVAAMGLNMMDRARTGVVMRHAFLGAVAQLSPATVELLRTPRAA
jgi:NTE family protein